MSLSILLDVIGGVIRREIQSDLVFKKCFKTAQQKRKTSLRTKRLPDDFITIPAKARFRNRNECPVARPRGKKPFDRRRIAAG